MSLDLESPLGFSSFLANTSNQRKVFIPSSFNMSRILKSVKAQKSVDLVCDKEFYEADLPGPTAREYQTMCETVENIIVSGKGSASSSMVFNAPKVTVLDPMSI